MKSISVLGSTGSVGTQSLDVIRNLKNYKVNALSAGNNIKLLESQIREFHPKYVCVEKIENAKYLKEEFSDITFFSGIEGLCEISKINSDIVLNAVSGFTGLYASFSAIEMGKTLILANKESIVSGAHFLMNLAKEKKSKILPIDSEHSAIWQCIDEKENFVKKIILTASGGPFFGVDRSRLKNVTIQDVIKHPTWKMGAKISVDSATMMNKGLEIIEAFHLFNVSHDSIDVLIHPQSVVHSMVEFIDGNIISQMSIPNMKFPIQYALTYPIRKKISYGSLDLDKIRNLSFHKPDNHIQEILDLFKYATRDNSISCALNAINEEAVKSFLNGKINFLDIENIVKKSIEKFNSFEIKSFEDIVYCDLKARKEVKLMINN